MKLACKKVVSYTFTTNHAFSKTGEIILGIVQVNFICAEVVSLLGLTEELEVDISTIASDTETDAQKKEALQF